MAMSYEGSAPADPDADSAGDRQGHGDGDCPVLVVDDDRAIASALEELLQGDGYRVICAENGQRALDLVEAGVRPCAIVLDLMMPVMDGWDFRVQQLQNGAIRETPVILLTATGFSRNTIRTQFGQVELLSKPPQPGRLLEALKTACGQSHAISASKLSAVDAVNRA
jgi:CheY-like chemotaxis protein